MSINEWLPTNFVLEAANKRTMDEVIERFREWSEGHPLKPHGLTDGWHNITPEKSEALLRRNPPGANRRISVTTVQYYGRQMKAPGGWKKTGQPIILSDKDLLLDAQHRCWAGLLTGASFPSYVVTNVEHIDNVFAYIDNGKARTAKDALQTAGVNGVANKIAAAIKISRDYDADAYHVEGDKKTPKLTPIEVLETVMASPSLINAAHVILAADYDEANELIDHAPTAIFVAWKIMETYNEEMLARFMEELGDPDTTSPPISLLRKKLLADQTAIDKKMRKSLKLGFITKAFNAWRLNQPMTRLHLRTDEWPKFADTSVAEAA
ncbi:hypothetical protein Q2941_18545 [Bradyrhizobium sp. UFLA05-153]